MHDLILYKNWCKENNLKENILKNLTMYLNRK